jgi:hypothetical protein
MEAELERVRKSFRAELVPLKHTRTLVHLKRPGSRAQPGR